MVFTAFSIFRRGRDRKQKLLKQFNTYNESNLQLLMNSYDFIASAKKTEQEKINHMPIRSAKTWKMKIEIPFVRRLERNN